MRIINFAQRNFKELSRDILSIIFTIILPLFLLIVFKQLEIPSDTYRLENFTPGIIVFSFSFITLFTATLVAEDHASSLLIRLTASPMKPYEYILGYTLSLIPIVIIQSILFFVLAIILGLGFTFNIILTILVSAIISIMFIMLGIMIGSKVSEKSASGIGSVIVQIVVFTSGMYFDTEMMGKVFNAICNILPFKYLLNITRDVLIGNRIDFQNVIIFLIYSVIITLLAIIIFKKNMTRDNK